MTTRLHRPYARKKGGPPSVTTILGCMDKPGLSWAAARETAMFAVLHVNEWAVPGADQELEPGVTVLDEAAAIDRLYRHHRGVWDHRAALGTLVHSVNECWAHGEDVDLEAMVDEVRKGSHVWARMDPAQVLAEAEVMVDGLEAFWSAFRPATISAEDVVRYPGHGGSSGYIGQNDWRVTMFSGDTQKVERWLLDVKTSGKVDPTEGLYPDSWRLQLAAYRYAKEIVDYDDKANETGTRPLEPVDRCGIVHVRADGSWALLPMQAGVEEHSRFLQLRFIWQWVNHDSKTPAVHTLPAPTLEEATA